MFWGSNPRSPDRRMSADRVADGRSPRRAGRSRSSVVVRARHRARRQRLRRQRAVHATAASSSRATSSRSAGARSARSPRSSSTDDGLAEVVHDASTTTASSRCTEGTRAQIRTVGLSGVANRFVDLAPGPADRRRRSPTAACIPTDAHARGRRPRRAAEHAWTPEVRKDIRGIVARRGGRARRRRRPSRSTPGWRCSTRPSASSPRSAAS